MATHEIACRIDDDGVEHWDNEHLALMWHVVQANPADGFRDSGQGELVERIGHKIIRRWLRDAPVRLYHHQGRHHSWRMCCGLGNSNTDTEFSPDERAMPAVVNDVPQHDC